MGKIKLRKEFYTKFVAVDEDGLHIYEPSDVESIVYWWLDRMEKEIERAKKEAREECEMSYEIQNSKVH